MITPPPGFAQGMGSNEINLIQFKFTSIEVWSDGGGAPIERQLFSNTYKKGADDEQTDVVPAVCQPVPVRLRGGRKDPGAAQE
ncbi:hypothetical protein GCM10023095_04720 [Pseudaeromonas paramecii]|uniref:Uncharacterized protein n=1 Tax=Pseudaeromonas paramecii TaxID=2138166 RepID=A0ABP8PYT6_9GAMM